VAESKEDWREQYLGLTTFLANLATAEIAELFTFDESVAKLVGARRTPLTRLGLVLYIEFLQLTGRSLNSVQMIPPAILEC